MSKQPVINKIKGDKELRDPFLLRILRSFSLQERTNISISKQKASLLTFSIAGLEKATKLSGKKFFSKTPDSQRYDKKLKTKNYYFCLFRKEPLMQQHIWRFTKQLSGKLKVYAITVTF